MHTLYISRNSIANISFVQTIQTFCMRPLPTQKNIFVHYYIAQTVLVLSTQYICKWCLPECLNSNIQWWHLLGFSQLCTLIWVPSLAAWAIANLHWPHLLDLLPLCIFIWFLRFAILDVVKLRWPHLLDFLPLCIFIWFLRFAILDVVKLRWPHLLDFLHDVSLYDFPDSFLRCRKIALITFVGLSSTV